MKLFANNNNRLRDFGVAAVCIAAVLVVFGVLALPRRCRRRFNLGSMSPDAPDLASPSSYQSKPGCTGAGDRPQSEYYRRSPAVPVSSLR